MSLYKSAGETSWTNHGSWAGKEADRNKISSGGGATRTARTQLADAADGTVTDAAGLAAEQLEYNQGLAEDALALQAEQTAYDRRMQEIGIWVAANNDYQNQMLNYDKFAQTANQNNNQYNRSQALNIAMGGGKLTQNPFQMNATVMPTKPTLSGLGLDLNI